MSLKRYVKEHPLYFFNNMSAEHLAILSEVSDTKDYKTGENLIEANAKADAFHLIQVGEVSIQVVDKAGRTVDLQTISSGEVLGFSWMMAPYLYRFDAVATEPTRTRVFDCVKLREHMENDPAFGHDLTLRFMGVLSQRLQASRLQILDMYGEFTFKK